MSSTLRLKLAGLMVKVASQYNDHDAQLKLTSRRALPVRPALVLPEKQRVNYNEAEARIDRTLMDKKVLST